MDFLKHIKDFGKVVFDSVVTEPYALGDFIARGILVLGVRGYFLS